MIKKQYDIVVIGAGSGGLTAARTAAQFGATVALLEKHKIGGDCLHTGCVPSKSLIKVARDIHKLGELSKFTNISVGKVRFDDIHNYIHSKIHAIAEDTDNAASLAKNGVDVVCNTFKFTSKDTVSALDDSMTIQFKKAIIATGSRPRMAEIPGINESNILTSDTIWNLTSLPKSLAVIGAGPIGLELGQAFAMLGSKVTVFEKGDSLLPRFDSIAGDSIAQGLATAGVEVKYMSSITGIDHHTTESTLHFTQNNKSSTIKTEQILLAIGRQPNVANVGLEKAGVKFKADKGIAIDAKLRTSNKHIYAVGDCVGGPLFTHWAGEQGAAAAIHALTGYATKPDASTLPNVTFTSPEVAQVGLTKKQLSHKEISFTEVNVPYSRIDKAIAENADGNIAVYIDKKGKILGSLIIGENSSELIGYIARLKHKGSTLEDFSNGAQAYPTYTIGLKTLAADIALANASSNPFVKLVMKVRGFSVQ